MGNIFRFINNIGDIISSSPGQRLFKAIAYAILIALAAVGAYFCIEWADGNFMQKILGIIGAGICGVLGVVTGVYQVVVFISGIASYKESVAKGIITQLFALLSVAAVIFFVFYALNEI